ncbi:CBS domain-containing protein [Halorussus marinus]|uniref:CBS domain-containing protein n=1 Tax=Halorussus marinus TaxID=2505976 RepID=UPI0010927F4E|nr:CBS domain-containing protein [Halorussus marinus]
MIVRDLMSEAVVTVESDATIQQAAARMLRHSVGSVIVTQEGKPVGIATKSDVLYAGVASSQPFEKIPLENVVSHPVVTVDSDASVGQAVALMKDNATKHLPVTDGDELKGILTTTDIAAHHQELFDDVRGVREDAEMMNDGEGSESLEANAE